MKFIKQIEKIKVFAYLGTLIVFLTIMCAPPKCRSVNSQR